jgi:hypothetical protein
MSLSVVVLANMLVVYFLGFPFRASDAVQGLVGWRLALRNRGQDTVLLATGSATARQRAWKTPLLRNRDTNARVNAQRREIAANYGQGQLS